MLVRPDVPIAATDRSVFGAPVWSGELLVGSPHTRHAAGRWGYVVTGHVGSDRPSARARVSLADLGDDRPDGSRVAVFDWRSRHLEVLPADGGYDVTLEHRDWDYRVLAPILGAGVAMIGDPSLYACAGDTRIADVHADSDTLTVTVLGANEVVSPIGWAEHPISARTWSPAAGLADVACTYDQASGVWELVLDTSTGGSGWTRLQVR